MSIQCAIHTFPVNHAGTTEYLEAVQAGLQAFYTANPNARLESIRCASPTHLEAVYTLHPAPLPPVEVDLRLTGIVEAPDGAEMVELIEADTILGVGCGPDNAEAPGWRQTWVLVISVLQFMRRKDRAEPPTSVHAVC